MKATAENKPPPQDFLIGAKEIARALSEIAGREFSTRKIYSLSCDMRVPIVSSKLGYSLTASRSALATWWGGITRPADAAPAARQEG